MISGCILAKNEQDLLKECLESIAGLCDEIIVIDNNSHDRTMEIALEFGCRVYEDSSESLDGIRNRFTEYAKYPWIFSIDADERLNQGSAEKIKKVLQNSDKDIWGYTVPKITYCGNGQWAESNFLKVYRNRKEIKYSESPIHASLTPSIQGNGKKVGSLDTVVHHMDAVVRNAQHKRDKYKNLIIEQLSNPTLDEETRYYLYCFLGSEYEYVEDWNMAEKSYNEALKISPPKSTMVHTFLCQLYYDNNQLERSYEISRNVLKNINAKNKYALFNISRILCNNGDYRGASDYIESFIQLHPNSATGYFNLSYIMYLQGRPYIPLLKKASMINPIISSQLIYEKRAASIYTKERITIDISDDYIKKIGEVFSW